VFRVGAGAPGNVISATTVWIARPSLVTTIMSLMSPGDNPDPGGTGKTISMVPVDDPRIGMALWWASDGRVLYAYREGPASERDDYGVYLVRVDERTGNEIGEPQQMTKAEGFISGISATSDARRLVLWRTNFQPQVFIAELDAGSRQWKAPRRLTLDANANIADAFVCAEPVSSINLISYRRCFDRVTAAPLLAGDYKRVPIFKHCVVCYVVPVFS
jgi:hypothetical protein